MHDWIQKNSKNKHTSTIGHFPSIYCMFCLDCCKIRCPLHHTNKPGWSHAWVLHGPEGSAVVSLNISGTLLGILPFQTYTRAIVIYALIYNVHSEMIGCFVANSYYHRMAAPSG